MDAAELKVKYSSISNNVAEFKAPETWVTKKQPGNRAKSCQEVYSPLGGIFARFSSNASSESRMTIGAAKFIIFLPCV